MPVVLITGATDGIGKQTAFELHGHGSTVLVHGRSQKKVDDLVAELGGGSRGFVADFSSLAEVKKMAAEVRSTTPRLDVLLNNAGVLSNSREVSEDGYELTFAVNHLAHQLLTNELLPLLQSSAPARIVNVSSMAHYSGTIHFNDIHLQQGYSAYGAYSQSKLANVLFSRKLAQELDPHEVTVNSLHPGVISTKLLHAGFGIGGDSLKKGSETPVFLSISPKVADITGAYFDRRKKRKESADARSDRDAQRLWDLSEELIAQAPTLQ